MAVFTAFRLTLVYASDASLPKRQQTRIHSDQALRRHRPALSISALDDCDKAQNVYGFFELLVNGMPKTPLTLTAYVSPELPLALVL
jgi:hypothetical protein